MSSRAAPPNAATLAHAVDLLRAGRLVAFPTETVYGLGADARNETAVRRIFETKGRPADHPVIVHIGDMAQYAQWAAELPQAAQALAQVFWPGPLTIIVRRAVGVHDVVTGGQDTIGLRMPSHPVARELLLAFGSGIAAPSANRFGRISATTAQHVIDDLRDDVDLVIDGGASPVGIESTIVACVDDAPMLLRPGAIDIDALARVLGRRPAIGNADNAPRASGTLPSHYAPVLPTRLVSVQSLEAMREDASIAVLSRIARKPVGAGANWIVASEDPVRYAHDLYDNLRRLDRSGASAIWIEEVPDDESWRAVRDRLMRATADTMRALGDAE